MEEREEEKKESVIILLQRKKLEGKICKQYETRKMKED